MMSLVRSLLSIAIVKMQCDRELAGFIGVALTYRMKFPIISRSIASYSLLQVCMVRFFKCKLALLSSYRVILFHLSKGSSACFLSSRSYPFSL
jgi:hypothetical protein